MSFSFLVFNYYKMSFFSLLETLFFISLAITFVLIIMLVYHFKGRLVILEHKTNTMFEIMSSMILEMKNMNKTISEIPVQAPSIAPVSSSPSKSMPFDFPPELFRLFQMGSTIPEGNESDDDEDEYRKIVVSDTELDSDDEDDDDNDNIKVISVDIEASDENAPSNVSLDDLIDQTFDLGNGEDEEENDEDEEQDIPELESEQQSEEQEAHEEPMDYRKLDVSYLRTMVLTRGLATDTKKLKKSDLIRLLDP